MQTIPFVSDPNDFLNPERGVFIEIALAAGEGDYSWVQPDNNVNIVRANIRLDNWRLEAIPQSKLDDMDVHFDLLRAQKLQVFLNFQYNKGSDADASKAQILEHIEQVEYLLVKHADIIIGMNMGFIGWWGEGHNSTNGLENIPDRKEILFAILDALPNDRMVMIRVPFWKYDIFDGDILDAARAFNGSNIARVGHVHDGLWAPNWGYGGTAFPYTGDVLDWIDILFAESPYVMCNGESSWYGADHLVSCANAYWWLIGGNWNLLNKYWLPAAIAALTAEGCWDDILKGIGYRFVLEEATLPDRAVPGRDLSFQIKFRNDGYGSLYNPRPVYLVFRDDANRYNLRVENLDPRWWSPGNHVLINSVAIPGGMVRGDYELSLWMPDAYASIQNEPEYAVRFANQNTWDEERGTNVLGQITVGGEPSVVVGGNPIMFDIEEITEIEDFWRAYQQDIQEFERATLGPGD